MYTHARDNNSKRKNNSWWWLRRNGVNSFCLHKVLQVQFCVTDEYVCSTMRITSTTQERRSLGRPILWPCCCWLKETLRQTFSRNKCCIRHAASVDISRWDQTFTSCSPIKAGKELFHLCTYTARQFCRCNYKSWEAFWTLPFILQVKKM